MATHTACQYQNTWILKCNKGLIGRSISTALQHDYAPRPPIKKIKMVLLHLIFISIFPYPSPHPLPHFLFYCKVPPNAAFSDVVATVLLCSRIQSSIATLMKVVPAWTTEGWDNVAGGVAIRIVTPDWTTTLVKISKSGETSRQKAAVP